MSLITPEVDLAAEIAAGNGITLGEVSRQQRTNPSTACRWVLQGLPRGDGTRVKLAAIKRGKKWVTTAAAVSRFFASLPNSEPTPAAPPIRTPDKRDGDCVRAKKALKDKFGI